MEQSTKKKVLIVGSLLVIAGVGGYFAYRWWKRKKEEQTKKDEEAAAALAASTNTSTGGGTKPSTNVSSPFKSAEEIKKFQDWMDSKNPNWVNGKNLNKGSGYGTYGPSTQKAWNTYGTQYTTSTPATVVTPSSLANLTDVLASDVNAANGKSLYASFNNSTYFNMNNQVAGQAKAGQLMGKIVSAGKGKDNSYSVTFTDPNGVKYWTIATYKKVQL